MKRLFQHSALGFCLLLLSSQSFAGNLDWQTNTLLLRSEVIDEASAARTALTSDPNLDLKLRAALKSNDDQQKDLALRSIGDLHRTNLMPDLLDHARSASDRQSFQAIHDLLPASTNEESVYTSLSERLLDPQLTAGAKVAILQSLETIHPNMPAEKLEPLLEDKNTEVRLHAVDLIGKYRVERNAEGYDALLLKAAQGKPYQMRLEALSWLQQAPVSTRKKINFCSLEGNLEVQSQCVKAHAL